MTDDNRARQAATWLVACLAVTFIACPFLILAGVDFVGDVR